MKAGSAMRLRKLTMRTRQYAAMVAMVGACAAMSESSAKMGEMTRVNTLEEIAQLEPPAAPSGKTDEAPVTVSGSIDVGRLVDLAAEKLKVTIEYDAAVVKGAVTVRSSGALNPEELWQFMNRALVAHGFVTVQADPVKGPRSYAVVKVTDVQPSTPRDIKREATEGKDSGAGPRAGYASILIRVQNRPTKEVLEAIKSMLSKPSGSASEIGTQGLLIVSDLTPRLEQVEHLVELIDAPAAGVKIEEVKLGSISSAAAIESATKIAEKMGTVRGRKLQGEIVATGDESLVLVVASESDITTWKDLLCRVDRRDVMETKTYSTKVFSVGDVSKLIEQYLGVSGGSAGGSGSGSAVTSSSGAGGFRMVVDELTGSMIVTGSAAQHTRIAELIERLDATQMGSTPMRAFPIKNRPVHEIVTTLSQLLQAGVVDAAGVGSDTTAAGGGSGPKNSLDTVRDVMSTNSAVPATSGVQRRGGAVVDDQTKTAHGGHEARRVTLTADEATNTLIAIGEPRMLSQIESMLVMLDVRQPQVMLEVMMVSLTDSDAMNLGVELERIGSLDGSAVKLASLFGLSTAGAGGRVPSEGSGFTGSVLNPGDFSVILKALQTINKGKTSSMPKLLVKNNERATFSSVLQQPVATTVSSNTSTTTSYGGTEDAGTTVSVLPQIAQGDHLSLTYDIKLSSFVGAATGPGLPPPKQQNTITSVAMIPDGHVVAVGGIELVSDSKGVSQVPGVGDIPLVGELFKSRTKSTGKTRFYTFLRATVLRNQSFEDLKYLSEKDGGSVGVDDGLPKVAPRVIRYATPGVDEAPVIAVPGATVIK